MNPVIIGDRIKALMDIRNIKRDYLAKKLGISYSYLTKKLNGQIEFNINEMWIIKDVLELDNKLCEELYFCDNFVILREEDN